MKCFNVFVRFIFDFVVSSLMFWFYLVVYKINKIKLYVFNFIKIKIFKYN